MALQRVIRSTIIDAPIERVWAVLRDFNSHVHWHPVVADSHIEDGLPPDQVGCVRNFRLADGAHLREQLLALSDRDYVSTYCILDSEIPLERYVATVRLKPVTDGRRTFWHWESTFATPKGRERELTEQVGRNVYEAGFEALRKFLHSGGDRPATPRGASGAAPLGQVLAGPAIVLDGTGGVDKLRLTEMEARPPARGEVRIRQTAIGLNFIDIYVRTGRYTGLVEPGGVPGFEAAGSVIDVGADVTHLLPADRVAYACMPAGAYASVRTMAADQVVRLPSGIGDAEAAALMLKGMTAEYCLFRLCRVRRGDVVLVHAAAGGLGMLCAQWATALGARVIGTVGSEEKARVARDYCEATVVRREGHFAEAVRRASNADGAQLVIDGLGEAAREENMAALAPTGHWISVGQTAGGLNPIDSEWLAQKSVTLSRPVIFHFTADRSRLAEMAQRVFDAWANGDLRPQIARYALGAVADAHRALQEGRTTGQVVLAA
jgi:NADPH:quinone reductase-like Zn-dependent oxidoreductase